MGLLNRLLAAVAASIYMAKSKNKNVTARTHTRCKQIGSTQFATIKLKTIAPFEMLLLLHAFLLKTFVFTSFSIFLTLSFPPTPNPLFSSLCVVFIVFVYMQLCAWNTLFSFLTSKFIYSRTI